MAKEAVNAVIAAEEKATKLIDAALLKAKEIVADIIGNEFLTALADYLSNRKT